MCTLCNTLMMLGSNIGILLQENYSSQFAFAVFSVAI